MKNFVVTAVGLLSFMVLPAVAGPVSFPECPAVGHDTTGCELLITVTAVNPVTEIATAFTVSTSSPDLGPFDGANDTLIGVLNASPVTLFKVFFTVAPGVGSFAFDGDGACKGAGSPLASIYSPGPTASECLNGQFWTTDAMDYASTSVTFCSFSLAAACVIVGEPSAQLLPGGSSWFSLPGVITADQITEVTPEPVSPALITTGLVALYLMRRRRQPRIW
jgi:hypothetical protein